MIAGALLALAAGLLIAETVMRPSKRNLELVAGIIFVALGIIAGPLTVLGFTTLLLPFPMHTSYGTTSTLLILAVGGLTVMKRRQYAMAPMFRFKSADMALGAYLLFMVLSLSQVQPSAYGEVMMHLVAFLSAVTLYYLVIQIVYDFRTYLVYLRIFMVAATFIGVIASLQTLFPGRTWLPPVFRFAQHAAEVAEGSRYVRVFATFAGISPFAEYVAISIILQYVLARQARSLAEKTFWTLSIIALLIGLAGSATRLGAIALAGGFAYMLVFGRGAIPRFQIFNLLFVGFALYVLSYSFISPLTGMMESRLSSLGAKDSSTLSRWGVMQQAIESIPDSPWLGHGTYIAPNTFRGPVGRNIHSLYLHIAYTIGVPGLFAFVWYLATLFRKSFSLYGNLNLPRPMREHLLAMHTALVIFIGYEGAAEYLSHAMNMHFVWIRFALLLALADICNRKIRSEYAE